MKDFGSNESTVKKIYGSENLKEILTNLLEKIFFLFMENIEK